MSDLLYPDNINHLIDAHDNVPNDEIVWLTESVVQYKDDPLCSHKSIIAVRRTSGAAKLAAQSCYPEVRFEWEEVFLRRAPENLPQYVNNLPRYQYLVIDDLTFEWVHVIPFHLPKSAR